MKKQTTLGELEVFDSHTHFFSHNFFSMLASRSPVLKDTKDPVGELGRATGLDMPPETVDEFASIWQDELDKNSVAKSILMASLPGDELSVAKAVELYPDRFAGAFFFDPIGQNALENATRIFDELNLKLICLFPAMHHFSVGDNENVKAIVGLVRDRPGTAMFVHCGSLSVGIRGKIGLPSKFDLRYSNPFEVHKLASEFPDVNFIIPHFGAGMFRETLMAADLCPNIYLDTSSSNKCVKYEAGGVDLTQVFCRTLDVIGGERLLFGTDSSVFPRGWNQEVFENQVRILDEIGISQQTAKAIFGGNLRRLLESK